MAEDLGGKLSLDGKVAPAGNTWTAEDLGGKLCHDGKVADKSHNESYYGTTIEAQTIEN